MQLADLPEKVTVLIARLSYSGYERVEIANWLVQTALALHDHPRVENVYHKILTGYPTSRVRNYALKLCRDKGVHFLLMIDDDVVPDVHSPGRAVGYDHLPMMRDQQNFLPSALEFALEHPGPCVIGAPYCAGPPDERVLVSRFREKEGDHPDGAAAGAISLECFTRDEAAERTGFEMVSALPTGLILIDVRSARVLKAPWFHYEYKDAEETELASTEDTVFTRNLCYLDVPQYCAWGSWCAHLKVKSVGRPRKYPGGALVAQVEGAIRDRLVGDMEAGRPIDRPNPAALRVAARIEDLDNDDAPLVPLGEEAAVDGAKVGEPIRLADFDRGKE